MAIGVILGIVGTALGLPYMVPPIGNAINKTVNKAWPNAPDTIANLIVKRITYGLPDNIWYDSMAELGYDKETADSFIQVNQFFPSAQDVIALSNSRAFEDSTEKRWGDFFKYPDEINNWIKRSGVSPEIFKYFWYAHWRQPDFFRLRDMYDRGIIERDIVIDALAWQGFSPYWQDKLFDVFSEIPTRTDITRMRVDDIITETQVYDYMRARHYSPDDAKHLTDWVEQQRTKALSSSESEFKKLSRSKIIEAYREHELTRNEAQTMLQELGYDQQTAGIFIKLEDADTLRDEQNEYISYLKEAVKQGQITSETAIDRLANLGLSTERYNYLVLKMRSYDTDDPKGPSKADLNAFLKKSVIDLATYEREMRNLGYSEQHIEWYIDLLGGASEGD